MQSFRLYHLFPLASRWEWMKCGIFCLCFFAWDFCLRFLFGGYFAGCYLLAVGFSAYFSTFTPTLWVSPPAFLLPRPRYGFSRLFFCSHAQFPLRYISISFRGGLFCLLFTPYAHAMGFPAYFPTFPPSFHSATYRLASGGGLFCLLFTPYAHAVGFPACFSAPTPKSIYSSKEIMNFL